jgi:hypothetical protein
LAARQPRRTDHEESRQWAAERGARPSSIPGTDGDGYPGTIGLDFPEWSDNARLQHITWEDWFEAFDDNNLALLVQEGTSRFNRLVSRDTVH